MHSWARIFFSFYSRRSHLEYFRNRYCSWVLILLDLAPLDIPTPRRSHPLNRDPEPHLRTRPLHRRPFLLDDPPNNDPADRLLRPTARYHPRRFLEPLHFEPLHDANNWASLARAPLRLIPDFSFKKWNRFPNKVRTWRIGIPWVHAHIASEWSSCTKKDNA